jgi:serine/threonine protein kinase/Tol biopolymer transport system component
MAINSERLRQIEELYHLARERTPGERETFLKEVCANDAELRRDVLALLAQDSGAGPMERPAMEVAASLLNDTQWTAGTKVGPYQIVSRVGQGGMGDVFRARDTRLGRNVAIKTAHAEFTSRFQREALAISALNHPHICTLYDVGSNYLVMELVEGETLTRHLDKGHLPMDLVLRYGAQLADALSAAHAKGITHRDLKPGNIVVASTGIKVLDFGLAKFARDPEVAADLVDTASASRSIIGTPAYMAPEQLQGKECDARTDIFALGLVLYEMATGSKAFTGDSQAELIAEIMRCQPDLSGLAPPQFAHIVERCLAKDPEERWQTARDVKLELEFLSRTAPGLPSAVKRKRRLWPAAVAVLGVFATALALGSLYFRTNQVDLSAVPLTSYPGLAMRPSVSPDGTRVAFIWNGGRGGNFDVYVKQIGPGNALPLTTSAEDEVMCRWSPDGNWIAFLRQGDGDSASVHVVPVLTGLEKRLGDAALQIRDNTTLGGFVDCLDWSPDGKWLVVSRRSSPGQSRGLDLLSVTTDEIRQLTSPPSPQFDVFAAFAPDGHALAFLRRNGMRSSLILLPLSGSLHVRGPEMEIATSLNPSIRSFAWTTDSRELIASAGYPESATLWRFRPSTGVVPRLLPFEGSEPAISSRSDRLVLSRHNFEWNIWSLELDAAGRAVGLPVRAFDSSKNELTPRFSPDGTKVAFGSNRSGFYEIWICRSDGSDCDKVTDMKTYAGTPSWSPKADRIAFDDVESIYVVSVAGGKPQRLAAGLVPRWSRNGAWIYYHGFSGHTYRISPSGGNPERVTRDRGGESEESSDEKWLYYRSAGQTMSLHRIPSGGGESTQVLPGVEGRNFIPLEGGIWYFTPNTNEGSRLEYYDLTTKKPRTVFRTSRPVFAGMTLSPNGRRLLFTQTDRNPSRDLMLVENFR